MATIYLTTYYIDKNDIRHDRDGTVKLIDLPPVQICAYIRTDNREMYVDITRMRLYERNIDPDMTLAAFIASRLNTQQKADIYETDIVPVKNSHQRYTSRLLVTDGHADNRVSIAYSSFSYQDKRNDTALRSLMTELVITPLAGQEIDLNNIFVTVNGVCHKTAVTNNELWVWKGFRNIRNSGGMNVCLYDTSALGGHTIVPIITPMISELEDGATIQQGAYVTMPPGVDLTDKTVLLSVDGYLHVLDGTYQVVSPKKVKIHTNKMDLIGNFINNPNTQYKSDLLGKPYNPYDDPGNIPAPPPTYTPTPRESAAFFLATGYQQSSAPLVYPQALLADFEYSGASSAAVEITRMIPMEQLTSDQFVYNALVSERSFFIVINNPRVYKKTYPLVPTLAPTQYERIGDDTPRGILQYNGRLSLSYNLYSSRDGQHTFSLDYWQKDISLWKTTYGQPAIPSPLVNPTTTDQRHPVELHELFSPN